MYCRPRVPKPLAIVFVCLWLITLPGHSAVSAKKSSAKVTKIVLPDAYSGAPYNTTIEGVEGLATGSYTCTEPKPALPGLTFTCSALQVSGTPVDTKTDILNTYVVQVTDVLKHTVELDLTLTVRPTTEKVIVGAKPVPTSATTAPPDFSKIKFEVTSPIVEGELTTAGRILNLPANGPSLTVQAWITPDGQASYLAPLKPPAGSTSTSPVTQVALGSDGSYSITFAAAIASGETVELRLTPPSGVALSPGEGISVVTTTISSTIPIGTMSLNVEKPVAVGAKTVSGTVSSMPVPAVKPVAASGANPATYGNFPGIVVWWSDAASGKWSQAAPTVGASPPQFLSVNADGSFVVTLPSALQSGQKIRVDVVPPPGRSFVVWAAPLPPPPPSAIVPHLSEEIRVLNDVALSQPTISTSPFYEGTTVLSGTATIPSAGLPVGIVVMRLNNQLKTSSDVSKNLTGKPGPRILTDEEIPQQIFRRCVAVNKLSSDDITRYGRLLPLTTSSSNTLVGSVDATAGTYKVTLAEALKQDDWIQIIQVIPAGADLPHLQRSNCASAPLQVTYPFDFHRTNLSFVAGVLISNSSSSSATSANFSQANQFYAFNADHAWRLPGYDCVAFNKWGDPNKGHCPQADGWHSSPLMPGNNSFFEGRFTAIPVSTAATTVSTPTSSASTSTTPTLLSSQKVFRVETGAFLPWVITHGPGDHPQGLFIGPLAKAGFDTITGAGTATNVILPGGTVGTLSFQTAYKFYAYGARLGNMSLSQSPNRAPLIEHYLDVTVGRYSNLQSYICHYAKDVLQVAQPGSSCLADYPKFFTSLSQVADSRKQLYRIDLEGLVRIPVPATAIPFYIGFNANIAQHTWQAETLDHGYAPPDDIRILFGTKIDIGTLLSSLKLGAN